MSLTSKSLVWRKIAASFRQNFVFPTNASANWFPGHMTKGLKMMERTLLETDLVIEVHDGRIPLSGRYVRFGGHITGHRPHILVLNKKDLAYSRSRDESEKLQNRFKKVIMSEDPSLSDVIFTNCKDIRCKGLQSVLPRSIELIQKSDRYHRASKPDSNILIIGVPNVGKSSLINLVRSGSLKIGGKATKVGSTPGVTRAMQTKIRVHDEPLIYLLDSPGILMPNIKDMYVALKLSLCASLKDSAVGEQLIADYLLFWLNSHFRFEYVEYMKLEEPIDNCRIMLAKSAIAHGFLTTFKDFEKAGFRKVPDLTRAANHFIKGFRIGAFGPLNLDTELLQDCE